MLERQRLARRAAVRSSTSPTGRWVITSRAISEPSVPWTSKPVPAWRTVKASWNWARMPVRKRITRHHAVLEARAGHARRSASAPTTSTGSSSSTKRSVSASWTVMSSIDAAAGLGLVDPPALEVRRQVDGVEDAGGERRADPALGDRPRASSGGWRRCAGGGWCPCTTPASRQAATIVARVGDGQRQRLLAQHVLAGGGRGEGLRAVQLVGGADVDGVDAGSASSASRLS